MVLSIKKTSIFIKLYRRTKMKESLDFLTAKAKEGTK